MNEKLERKYRLKFSDFNCFDVIAPYTILDLFQDVAGEHANYIGVGFDDLIQKGLAWVLVRTKFEVVESPKEYSEISVLTWPKIKGKVDFDREYLIKDDKGNILVKGISKWVIIDYKTRRITPAKNINYTCDICHDEYFPGAFPKIADFDVEDFDKYESKTSYIDLDHNGHVNNIAYCRYISNALCLKENEVIKSFEINYIKELTLNEEFFIYSKKIDNTIFIKGVIKDTNEISFISLINLR